ncbi:class I mannose-6-phosphate isomerase [Actinomadura verrucosospora]|uniref:Phosphohexomutase n=1 Tax=Actinomadura verrucosospora TaxID=46165 RepID=A0A7D3VPA0_ACTVE|nr:class I mannose-6-phosphate isomerase [Actinomadura verrucosospora]QKG18793.1 Mannose-6-phosphate isomerase [Actinomadura verrucosospora]
MRPIVLPANQPRHFYRGGAAIARFRGARPVDEYRPEDWVGSMTGRFGEGRVGVTVLPDGVGLPEAVAADPEGWLGPGHVTRWGATTGFLVKLLDAGQRLPVHCHPTRAFARAHLGSSFGKTEAWLVLDTPGRGEGLVHLGFREDVPAGRLREWSAAQDRRAMLAATHPVRVRPGDAVFIPAGLPHAIDAGVFVVELQEPTDFSVMLEWEGFAPAGDETGHLRLGWDTALQCVDRRAWAPEEVAELVRAPSRMPGTTSGVRRVLPEAADPFFRAELAGPQAELSADFAVLVVLRGTGELHHGSERLPLRTGQTVLVPYGAGPTSLRGRDIEVLRCLPPVHDAIEEDAP